MSERREAMEWLAQHGTAERSTQPAPLPGPVDAPLPLWDMTNRELLAVLARDPWRHGAITSTILANRLRRMMEAR